MNKLPTVCPICQSELEVTRTYCAHCDTTLEGHFSPSANPFSALNKDQMYFLMTFIRCEGRLNRMEEELNLSYPTLRKSLQEILRVLGFEPKPDDIQKPSSEDRLRILDSLAKGEITAEAAQIQLAGKKVDN